MKIGEARVIKHTGSHYQLSELPKWDLFPATLRGKIRLKGNNSTNPVAVGDRVRYELTGDSAVITDIFPRENYLIRKSTNLSRQAHIIAANIDMAFLVVSIANPEIKLPFLDRLLVSCEIYHIPVTILLNKADTHTEDLAEQVVNFHEIYTNAGYKVINISARTGKNIEKLREICKDKVCLFSGVSGVGKSSLIHALDPSLDPKIGKISEVHLQGKHTTTFYEMYKLESGGFIIDTPGIRGFGLVDIEKEEISKYCPEMLELSDNCKFIPCTHTHEPKCAIKEAVETGEISIERYSSYVGMLEENGKYR